MARTQGPKLLKPTVTRKVRDAGIDQASQPDQNAHREDLDNDSGTETWPERLCNRCIDLDVHCLLITDDVRTYADLRAIGGSNGNPNNPSGATQLDLGVYRYLNFDPGCTFCNFLEQLVDPTTVKENEHIYLIPSLSIHRLEPDVSLVEYGKACKYTNYLYLGQMMNYHGQQRLPYCHEVSNAFGCAAPFDPAANDAMLLRRVNPSQVSMDLVRGWLSLCAKNHGDICRVTAMPELGIIRLIDVKKMIIVPYTEMEGDQYLCLSYVWGERKSHLNTTLQNLPATISDAIEFVRLLGQRYLWVDMVSSFPH